MNAHIYTYQPANLYVLIAEIIRINSRINTYKSPQSYLRIVGIFLMNAHELQEVTSPTQARFLGISLYECTRTSGSDFAHSSCFPRLVEVFRLRQHRSQGTFQPMGGAARDRRPCPCAVTFDDEPLASSARKPFPEGITHGAWGLFSTFGARYVCLVRN